jgi:hypothetical protein
MWHQDSFTSWHILLSILVSRELYGGENTRDAQKGHLSVGKVKQVLYFISK